MSLYTVRTAPTAERAPLTVFPSFEEARAFADENALYGGAVYDTAGRMLYAAGGEISSAILYHAKCICDTIRDEEFVYGHAPINPAFNHDARIISCDRLVDWILYRAGFTDQPYIHGKCVSGPWLTDWCLEHGFTRIDTVEELLPGDVVFVRPNQNGDPLHTFIYAGKGEEEGMHYRYDAGKNERIRSTQPSCEPLNDFICACRAPSVRPIAVPALSFTYGGTPFDELEVTAKCEADRVIYTLPDGVELTVVTEFLQDYGVTRWTNHWRNPTDHRSALIENLCDCDLTIPMAPDPARTRRNKQYTWEPKTLRLFISDGANINDHDHTVTPHRMWAGDHKEVCNQAGRSGMGTAPFFEVNEGGDHQNGMLTALGWTGQWKAYFDRGETDFRIRHSLPEVSLRMAPGESFRTASATVMPYREGQVNAHNLWRRFIREAVSPMGRFKGERGTQCPFSAIFWGGIPSDELMERWEGILSHGLDAFDYCWVDAGWYEPLRSTTTATQSADWGNVGTWEVNKFYHPKGYRDVTDFLHERGMKFQLWFEPERMRRSVCEWTDYLWTGSPEDNDVLIDIGKDEVCDQLIERISKVIAEVGVDCYRQDFNFNPLATWTRADRDADPNGERKGATEIHHINNLWRFWDALLERFPHLLIDDCAGGGHRIDIEMLSRSVPLWRSDYQCTWDCCPEVNQNSNMRAAWWYPYSGIGYGPTLGDTYSFRSAYTGGMTVRTWEHADPEWRVGGMNEPFDWAKRYFAEYARLRHYFAEDFFPLIPPSDINTTWVASQYHARSDGSGLILAFRRALCPYEQAHVELGGIDRRRNYVFTNEDTGESFTVAGTTLLAEGLTLTIPEKRQSLLLTYREA